MKRIIFLFSLVTILSACKDDKKAGDDKKEGFVIEGKIEGGRGSLIKLGQVTMDNVQIIATDTADLEGNFRLEGYSREKFIAIFNYDETQRVFLVVDTNSRIKLDITENHDIYTVEGSEESDQLRRLRDIEVRSGKEIAELRKEGETLSPDNEAAQNKLREKFMAVTTKYNNEFIDSFKNSSSILIPLFFYYNLQLPLDDQMKKEIYERAQKSGSQNSLVADFMRKYKAELATAVGQPAPDISVTDTNGTTLTLSELRGKVVLVDFWASWCKPCRMENPNVLNVYRQYKDKGFEIVGVSLDNDRSKWIQAIQEDGINWKHGSDMIGRPDSEAARLYAVTSIPSTFLIDREGKIIAKNLRGPALQQKIAEVLR